MKFQKPHKIPYQLKAIEELKNQLQIQDPQKVILSLPTGAGKTYVAAQAIVDLYLRQGKRILWLSNKWIHLYQFIKTLEEKFESEISQKLTVQIITSDKNKIFNNTSLKVETINGPDGNPDITISTTSTLGRIERRYQLLRILKSVDILIIDEAHWGIDGVLRGQIEEMSRLAGVHTVALTATPKRGLYNYSTICSEIKYLNLAHDEGKYLAKCIPISIPTQMVYKEVPVEGISELEAQTSRLIRISRDSDRNLQIANIYKNNKDKFGKTIIFCTTKYQANEIASYLDCPALHSDNDTEGELIRFMNNEFDVCTTVNQLKEGVDIPDLRTIFITYEVGSDISYAQMVGRATRTNNGTKEFFYLVDFFDTFKDANIAKILDPRASDYIGSGGEKNEIDFGEDDVIEAANELEQRSKSRDGDFFEICKQLKFRDHKFTWELFQFLSEAFRKSLRELDALCLIMGIDTFSNLTEFCVIAENGSNNSKNLKEQIAIELLENIKLKRGRYKILQNHPDYLASRENFLKVFLGRFYLGANFVELLKPRSQLWPASKLYIEKRNTIHEKCMQENVPQPESFTDLALRNEENLVYYCLFSELIQVNAPLNIEEEKVA